MVKVVQPGNWIYFIGAMKESAAGKMRLPTTGQLTAPDPWPGSSSPYI